MRRLAGARELLDGPLDDPGALRGNLRDLTWINRRLGGTAASLAACDALIGRRSGPHTVLDVGTGAGDIPLALIDRSAGTDRPLAVTGIDTRPEVLAAAGDVEPRLRGTTGLDLVVGDARSLPWPDGAFDVVHASLLLHHLEPTDAIAFLREAARVARHGVVVNDLVRARHHLLGAHALFAITTRNAYTRHDGPLSVRRAYTRAELRALLVAAGLRPVAEVTAFAGHRVAIAAVPVAAEGGG